MSRDFSLLWRGRFAHNVSGQIARRQFGGGVFGGSPSVEGRQPEPAASVAGGGPRRNGPRRGGEDRRHRSQTLRDWVHRFNVSGPTGLIDNWTKGPKPRLSEEQLAQLAKMRRGRAGPRERQRRPVAADRPQASHRREVRRRLSSALCRKAPQEARLLAHQRAAASSGSGRADRRSVQNVWPAPFARVLSRSRLIQSASTYPASRGFLRP